MNKENKEYLYGYYPVYLALSKNTGNRGLYRLFINKNKKNNARLESLIRWGRKKNVEILKLDKKDFNNYFEKNFDLIDKFSNQGVVLEVSSYNYYYLDKYLSREIRKDSRLAILDGVTDVGNFGSIIRNCSAFSFDGILISKDRSVPVNKRVSKISAGALENVRIFRVTNLVRNMKKLKEAGFWVYGTASENNGNIQDLGEAEFTFPLAIVFGSEGRGLSRLVEENCDFMVRVEMGKNIQSLNISVASGIIMHRVYMEKKNG
ncbi:MAG: 23S rRNA (guanosine(2251)-2'-O)-methyltransferase RlmB [Candidatus Humimicrobiaceae bacterium]